MSKILIFSRDPGGANAVIPLVQPLRQDGYEVMLYGKDSALVKYRENNLEGRDIKKEIAAISIESVKQFLSEKQLQLIITGTSADDDTEKFLWRAAELLGIYSFAILDQWVNYGLRFSPYGVAEADMFNRNPRIAYLPSKICVMDELAQEEAMQEGIDRKRLVVTGQPYFEALLKGAARWQHEVLREQLRIEENEKVLLFVSEPICDTYKEGDTSDHYWGYTERTIFRLVLEAAETLPAPPTIIVRHHPKEKKDNFLDIIDSVKKRCRVIVDKGSPAPAAVNTADLIVGMSSMFLIEAALLGKRVLSVQIGLRRKDPFVLGRMGATRSITDWAALAPALKEGLAENSAPIIDFNFIKNPVHNIMQEVKKII